MSSNKASKYQIQRSKNLLDFETIRHSHTFCKASQSLQWWTQTQDIYTKRKKSKNLFPFIAQEIRTKTFIDEQPLTLF